MKYFDMCPYLQIENSDDFHFNNINKTIFDIKPFSRNRGHDVAAISEVASFSPVIFATTFEVIKQQTTYIFLL